MQPSRSTVAFWIQSVLAGFCLAVGAPISPAQAVPLRPPLFSVDVLGEGPGFTLVDDNVDEITPFSYDTGVVNPPDGGSWQFTAQLSGGSAPTVRVEGWEVPGVSGYGLSHGIASLSYIVRPTPLPAYSAVLTSLPVPMTISGYTYAGLVPIPGLTLGGFAESSAQINGPGFTFLEGYDVTATTPGLEIMNNFSHSVSVAVGNTISVLLMARGVATGQWIGLADPVFEIDPTATFDYQGETLYYTDAFTVEYSEGLLVPEPSTATLCAAGLLTVAAVGRRRPRR